VVVKGVKLISNTNNSSFGKKYNNNLNKFSAVTVKNVETPNKQNGEMGDIINDYDKSKTFNKELIKNIGSPKGPIYARAQAKIQLG
jgi:hypothetical protein